MSMLRRIGPSTVEPFPVGGPGIDCDQVPGTDVGIRVTGVRMSSIATDELRDEIALHWNWLEGERDPCVVVSERMEFVYDNAPARALVPPEWFGKHCSELLPVVDQTGAFHCPKITSVTEATEVVYCEETVCSHGPDCEAFGVELIPLGTGREDRRRAMMTMRGKSVIAPGLNFEARLVWDAEAMRDRIVARGA